MWTDEEIPEDRELRQGDLISGAVLPKLSLPLRFAHVPGTDIERAPILLDGQRQNFVVISQCCNIENSRSVALAPVRLTQPLPEGPLRAALLADEPPPEEDVTEESLYVFDQFRLDPVPGYLGARTDNKFWVIDLNQAASYSGDREELRRLRVRRMTPAGRRLLRIKLLYFWARPEEEDVAWLTERGVPAGLSE